MHVPEGLGKMGGRFVVVGFLVVVTEVVGFGAVVVVVFIGCGVVGTVVVGLGVVIITDTVVDNLCVVDETEKYERKSSKHYFLFAFLSIQIHVVTHTY